MNTKYFDETLPMVRIDFTDWSGFGIGSRGEWSETGRLERCNGYFVLHVLDRGKPNGTRVFPMAKRRAEVYFLDGSDGDPFVVEPG